MERERGEGEETVCGWKDRMRGSKERCPARSRDRGAKRRGENRWTEEQGEMQKKPYAVVGICNPITRTGKWEVERRFTLASSRWAGRHSQILSQ